MSLLARIHDERGTWTGPFSLKTFDESTWAKLNASFYSDGTPNSSGVTVTAENAFTFSAVYDAVNQISSDVAKLPLNLHKRREGGGSDHYVGSKLYRLLKYQPNPEMGSMVFRRTLTAHALTLQGGFAEIERDQIERPIGLWPLNPMDVKVDETDSGSLIYKVRRRDKSEVELSPRNVLHIHGLGFDGYCAYPVIGLARQAIGMALAAERFGSTFFGNGSTFGGIIENGPPDLPAQKQLREQIESMHRGPDRAHRLLMLWGAMKFVRNASLSPQESNMQELRDQQVEEVARFFNMPVYKLKVTKPGAISYASIEQNALEYYKGAMLNWITLWEEEINRKLISPLEFPAQFVKHNANAFLRGDIESRYKALGSARERGIISADDWREMEDMNPLEGGQGKLYLVQEQNIPLSRINELIDSKIAKNEAPKAPPPSGGPASGDDGGRAQAMADALERASRAEALAADARQELAATREHAAALEASSTDTAEDRDRLRASEVGLVAQVAVLEQVSRDRQADLDRLQAERDQERAKTDAALEAKAAAESGIAQAMTEAERIVLSAQQMTAAAMADVSAEQDKVMALTVERDAAAAQAAEASRQAEAARIDADEARQAVLAREATLTVERDDAQALSERATATLAEVRVQQGQAETEWRARLDEATQALQAADTAREAAEAARTSASDALLVERDRLQALADDAAERAEQAAREADETRTAVEAAEQARVTAQTAREAAESALTEARQFVMEAEENARQASVDAAQWTADLEAATVEVVEAQARRQAAESRLTEAQTALEQQQAAAEAERQSLTVSLTAAESARVEAERALGAQEQAERDRRIAVIAAHRGLIVDALGRMVRRECQQARAKWATAPKLRTWLSGFPAVHEPICLEALLPAMRAHLAWQGSQDDPVEATTVLVREHIAAFTAQVSAALEADPDDFHSEIDRVLTRWETDRAAAVADALMTKEIRHVR